eukprot:PhM_4_TR3073/c1_g3_i2/m.102639
MTALLAAYYNVRTKEVHKLPPQFIVKLGKTPGTTLIPSLQGLTDVKKGRVKTLNYFVTGDSTGWMRTEIFTEIVETYLEIISPMLSSSEKQVLIVLDIHASHKDEQFLEMVENKKNVLLAYVAPGMTSKTQVMDVVANKPYKEALRKSVREERMQERCTRAKRRRRRRRRTIKNKLILKAQNFIISH